MDRDAIVFTVFLSPSLPGLNLVRQMVGRGSRSFGRCIGYVHAIAPIVVSTNASLSAQLELRDKVEYSMQGVEILKLAMKAWKLYGDDKNQGGPFRKSVIEALGMTRWRTDWSKLTASKKQGIPDIKKALQYLK